MKSDLLRLAKIELSKRQIVQKFGKHKKIGFIGTASGMTNEQLIILRMLMTELEPIEFHHADFQGSDSQAHDLVASIGSNICIHPPYTLKRRAFKQGTYYQPKDYPQNNKDVVDCVDMMVACPKEFEEIAKSKTWSIIRYARNNIKAITYIWPDGSITEQQYFSHDGDF